MFLVLLTYTKPLEVVDAHIPAHREFLARNYAAGLFLLSGRKEPREGGVILASASSAQELQKVLAEDPFQIHGVAKYQLVQFTPTMAAPAFEALVAAKRVIQAEVASRRDLTQVLGSMGTVPNVRCATVADASAVARLLSEWGYPSPESTTIARLGRLIASSEHLAIVAELDGATAGWATGEVRLSLGSDPRVEITGLVVAAAVRRAGVGRFLVAQIEAWALEKGCRELFLRSNIARPEAHPFYERLGYERTKTQHAYRKVLRPA
jgi:uncharacterized protein YciI/GNAT superfamily N-acetyltransferase